MKNIFRRIKDSEVAAGYDLIVARTNWLNQQGIPQWSRPIPEAVIRERQRMGGFFGYWSGDRLVAVVCLLASSVSEWDDLLQGKYLYLATLTSALQYKGSQYGRACVLAACQYARENGYENIYLDCMDHQGRLPAFYTELGFEILDRKQSAEGRVDILMVKAL
jgi:GNAT superfamily N-acetyltransferase